MWLLLAGQSISGVPSAVSGPGLSQSVATSDETSIDALRREVADLQRKIDKPPKDLWDKFASVSAFASALAVALIGFYATNVYNKRQRVNEEQRNEQEEQRKEQASDLEKKRFDHERQEWREELSNQVTLKILEARLKEYGYLWARIELVAKHQMSLGDLTQDLTRQLASDVQKWRYSLGGLLAAPLTRNAAIAFQTAVLDFKGNEES